MAKKILLKLKSINYSGDSVGDDIRLEIEILGNYFSIEKRIKVGTRQSFNNVICEFSTDTKIFEAHLNIKVIEKDLVFNDIGNFDTQIKIDTDRNSQEFIYKVKVKELRMGMSRTQAVFEVDLQASILETERYLSETEDGWVVVKIDGIKKQISLPSFLKVKLYKSDTIRDYFDILEGYYIGKKTSVKKKPDGSSYLQLGFLDRNPVELQYSLSKKSFILDGEKYNVDDDPRNLFALGTYDIEISDAPHNKGRKYLDRSKFALIWFHVGHNLKDDRFIHTGTVSAGCVSMKEIKKWDLVCKKLLIARKGDGMSVGVLKVVE